MLVAFVDTGTAAEEAEAAVCVVVAVEVLFTEGAREC